MSTPEIRPATEADLASVTGIYDHAVRFGTATFELVPPDLGEMTQRFRALTEGGYAYPGAYRARPAYRFTVENSIYLQPAIHRRGIGGLLLRRLIGECEARGQ